MGRNDWKKEEEEEKYWKRNSIIPGIAHLHLHGSGNIITGPCASVAKYAKS